MGRETACTVERLIDYFGFPCCNISGIGYKLLEKFINDAARKGAAMHPVVPRKEEAPATTGKEKGQSLVEYALLLLLVALVVIAMVKGFGQQTNNTYSKISSGVSNAVGQ